MTAYVWTINNSITLTICFSIILIVYIFNKRSNLPPGPRGLPFFGSLLSLKQVTILQQLDQFRKEYGDIYTVRLGQVPYIFINGYDNLKEVFLTRGDEFSSRPSSFLNDDILKRSGIMGSSGLKWKKLRSFTVSTFRNLGFGTRNIEIRVQEEVENFLHILDTQQGQPMNPSDLIHTCVANVICSIVFGKRFEHDDPIFEKLLHRLHQSVDLFAEASIVELYPFLKYVPGDIVKCKRVLENTKACLDFAKNIYEDHKETFDENNMRDYIDNYIKEMKTCNIESEIFTELNLTYIVTDLFSAGTETTSGTLRWAILYLLHYKGIQERIYQEIERVVGTSRPIRLSDRANLPYCEAFITETLRCGNIAPLSIQHSNEITTKLKGYDIPAGTSLVPNLDSVLNDPNLFTDPHTFDPSRFINREGQFSGSEKVISFSIGRRVCLGESLARTELFLFLTSMIQRYKFLPEDENNLPTLNVVNDLSRAPRQYMCCVVRRTL